MAESEYLQNTSENNMWYAKDTRYEMFISALHIQIPFYVTLSFYIMYFLWAASRKRIIVGSSQNSVSDYAGLCRNCFATLLHSNLCLVCEELS